MTMTLTSQRRDRDPAPTTGDDLVCQHDGVEVTLRVTAAQPPLHDGRWVSGTVGGRPAVVWVTW